MATTKDWIGNYNSIYKTIGASNHTEEDREEHDYYATNPLAVELLCEIEMFSKDILEPCAGEGHISKVLESHGYNVESTDLIDRGYGKGGVDFLTCNQPINKDIITNPPYSKAQEFVEHAMELITDGHKVAMFLKLSFLEGQSRRQMFEKYPPKTVWVSSSRLGCAKNGEFKIGRDGKPTIASAVAYAWFIWEKEFNGSPTIKWFN